MQEEPQLRKFQNLARHKSVAEFETYMLIYLEVVSLGLSFVVNQEKGTGNSDFFICF